MQKFLTYENLADFAYSNDKHVKGKVNGVIISYRGLGACAMISDDTETEALRPTVERALRLADAGYIFFVPYTNPWSWMNEEAVALVDDMIDVLFEHYSLDDTTPIISSGGSMGGMCALTYMVYAKRTPAACVANCPVCDVPFHFTERPDLPRTFYSAYYHSDMTMEEALQAHSPLHLADRMPHAQYRIFHCENDRAVNIDAHSKKFVEALSARMPVTFHTVPEKGHCALTPEMALLYEQYLMYTK